MSIRECRIEDLSETETKLVHIARDVMVNAYNLYSNFFVGAVALSKSGNIYKGTFMENASFGITICAEPAALLAATSAGDLDILEMAVVGGISPDSEGQIVTPCGRCRQMIYEASEISDVDITIICANGNLSKLAKMTISDLLPLPFGPKNLGMTDEMKKFRERSHKF